MWPCLIARRGSTNYITTSGTRFFFAVCLTAASCSNFDREPSPSNLWKDAIRADIVVHVVSAVTLHMVWCQLQGVSNWIFRLGSLRWLGTVVTSHTASNRQAYTPVMSMLQKAVQSTHCKSHCNSCNQPAHTNVIMLYAVKCSLYVVGPFLCRTLHKSWSTGGENVTKLPGVPKRTRWHMNFFR